jgi:predicted nucleotidyltransferase
MNFLTLRSLFEIFEPVNVARIRENILRDSRYPVHEIADKLIPYLKLLVEKFNPDQIVLFGSYAYGNPTRDSDVDLLIVKKTEKSPREEATAIRKAFQPLRHSVANLAFDIMVRDPEDLRERIAKGGAFHSAIIRNGIRLA